MYILNPLKDKSHFTIMVGDPVEKDVFESLATLIEKHGELQVQKAVNKYFCSFILFHLITVMISFP